MKHKYVRLFALLLTFALLFSFAACTSGNEEEEEVPTIISKTELPKGKTNILAYFNRLMEDVKTQKPAVEFELKPGVSSFECENDELKNLVPTLKTYMIEKTKVQTETGDDLKDAFPVRSQAWGSHLTAEGMQNPTCVELGGTYEIYFTLPGAVDPERTAEGYMGLFTYADVDAILAEFAKAEKFLTIGDYSLEYVDCYVKCIINRETDQITELTLRRNVLVTTTVTGTGTLADIGEQAVSFKYEQTETYKVDWTALNGTDTAK